MRKFYQVIPDDFASDLRLIRIIDESGEDYLYPDHRFLALELPRSVEEALLRSN